ncbi:MAG: hypothetical protein QS748_07835 [Candidatus Endonucleobacter bathymodioli]|uniref:Uncharacterized protein n=1 Tax=Candidatus Endonucleibacter bathymodioli TaxID=539814 RepID=A0AA90NRA9_9GAMM|nr:hypothetical protein [Candidatus Endonucleobacter bathymodioli]
MEQATKLIENHDEVSSKVMEFYRKLDNRFANYFDDRFRSNIDGFG